MTDGEHDADSAKPVWPLGKYLVLAELGRGGMAEVYLGLARGPSGFNKLAVLKLLRPHLTEDPEFLEMFLAEARLAARLNHPNVVSTYEVSTEGDRPCIVMEYLEGRTLSEIEHRTRDRASPISLYLRILADSLAGLHYAHELHDQDGLPLEIVHRDVSPHNIVVTYDGLVKLLDFGIAKAANSASRTKTGVFKGKLRYTAPERLSGEETDRRSDIFSVGVMMWQALSGEKLWPGLSDLRVMHNLVSGTPIPPPRTVNPNVDARLDAICVKALAVNPRHRFQTAAEFQDAIEDFLSAESTPVTARLIGKFMAEIFGESRAQFQRVVDEQMRIASSIPSERFTDSMSRMRVGAVPVLGFTSAPPSGSVSLYPYNPSTDASGISASRTLSSAAPAVLGSTSPPARANPTGRYALAVVLAALLVLGVVVVLRSSASEGHLDRTAAARGVSQATVVTDGVADGVTGTSPIPAGSASGMLGLAAPPPGTAASAVAVDGGAGATAASATPHKTDAPAAAATPPRWVPPPPRKPQAPAPAPEPARAEPARPSPRADEKRREADCASPYYLDEDNVKKIRPECL